MNLYDAAYLAAAPPAAALLGWKMLRHGKYRESAPAMLGCHLRREDSALWRGGSVWVHAVSVGEVIAARAMLPLLKGRFAPLPILLTTHTETGQAAALAMPPGMADAVRYYPLDFSWIIRRAASVYQPRVFILMETELWPNALNIISGAGAKIFILNGKISEKSSRGYMRFRRVFHQPLSRVSAFCMQTEADALRISAIKGSAENVFVTGNCKFDAEVQPLSDEDAAALRATIGLTGEEHPLAVAGSTHPGEESIILQAWEAVSKEHPHAALILAPRHPERFAEVWSQLAQSGIPARRVSDGAASGSGPARVFLLDKMGILSRVYGLADAAIVAGSFVEGIGGHNILEPAGHGVPVIYGPHMKSQPDMTRILSSENGGTVASAQTLAPSLLELFADESLRREKGRRGRDACAASRGSAARNMEILGRYL